MASELVPIAKIEKPEVEKNSAISKTSVDQPIELESNAQVEMYSDMGRTRTGIQNSEEVWGDRSFGMRRHPCAKPADLGH